jgi:hypothetical protein
MMPMATLATSVKPLLLDCGLRENVKGFFTAKTVDAKVELLASAHPFSDHVSVMLGAVAPRINQAAFAALNTANAPRSFHPQYSPAVAPPIFISSIYRIASDNDLPTLREQVSSFIEQHRDKDLRYWVDLALSQSPFAQAQQLLIPAYLHAHAPREELREYVQRAKLHPLGDIYDRYFEYMVSLMEPEEKKRAMKRGHRKLKGAGHNWRRHHPLPL